MAEEGETEGTNSATRSDELYPEERVQQVWAGEYTFPESGPLSGLSSCSSDYIEECYEEGESGGWIILDEASEEEQELYGEEEEKVEEEEVPETLDEKISLDSEYLKQVLGTPLTYALLEIATKRPTDPIHYLAHYLIKWRWNGISKETYEEEVRNLTAAREARMQAERERERQEMLRKEQEEEELRRAERVESSTEKSSIGEEEEEEGYEVEDEEEDKGVK